MKWRIWTIMLAVAVAALGFRAAVHLRALIHKEAEFALPIFLFELFAAGVLFVMLALLGCVASLEIQELAHSKRLRRQDVPAAAPSAELLATDWNRPPPTIGLGDADGDAGNPSQAFGAAAPCDRLDPPPRTAGPPIAP